MSMSVLPFGEGGSHSRLSTEDDTLTIRNGHIFAGEPGGECGVQNIKCTGLLLQFSCMNSMKTCNSVTFYFMTYNNLICQVGTTPWSSTETGEWRRGG